MHKIPANIAKPEPFYKVVLLFTKNTIAAITSKTIDNAVINQIVIFGKIRVKSKTKNERPKEINTPQHKNSIDFCEFHL
jgi:hypothetical protein